MSTIHPYKKKKKISRKIGNKAKSICYDIGPEFSPPFRWRSKHQTKNHSAYH